jgi:hypothetical protein
MADVRQRMLSEIPRSIPTSAQRIHAWSACNKHRGTAHLLASQAVFDIGALDRRSRKNMEGEGSKLVQVPRGYALGYDSTPGSRIGASGRPNMHGRMSSTPEEIGRGVSVKSVADDLADLGHLAKDESAP